MRYIFYHYNHFGTLVFDYYDEETHVSQSYMFYAYAYVWNKSDDFCSEFGTIGIRSFGGGIKRVA